MTIPDRLCRSLVFGTLVLGISGCIVIPVPLAIDNAVEARRDAVGESMVRFQPGTTTRRDVVLAFGEPDAVSIDECKLIYWAPKWRVFGLILGYYIFDWGTVGNTDFFVAEFDDDGLLVKFEEAEICPPLMVSLALFEGQKVLLQQPAIKIEVVHWGFDKHLSGTILFTEAELIFISHKPIANAPDLRMAYSDITDEQLKGLTVEALWIRCRSGAEYKFWIDHLNPDEAQKDKALQQARSLIQSRLAP